ncbi:MAG TPA: 1,4-alpha-glucan branching enzyme [Cyanothece sp. UBA12306]|nr:1,4-alpha-glucan branching enzyme [Cyanothece sp. UBA12306]
MKNTVANPNSLFSDEDLYLFGEGKHHRIYEKLGAHPVEFNSIPGVYFAIWAPNAHEIAVIGDFNHWNRDSHLMKRIEMDNPGIWELFIPNITVGEKYKFAVKNHHKDVMEKTDPYGYQQEVRPATASIVTDLSYTWHDQDWLNQRAQKNPQDEPVSVYEVHLGSWKHTSWDNAPKDAVPIGVPYKDNARFLNYRELADQLIPYVKEMGYTHIELLPVTEYPFDGSWGYQVVGYFAVTSRYGTPQDFMYFVDQCHQQGIGVLIDWVPGHFPKDSHGLARFDFTTLYEYEDPRKGEHLEWGTLVFDYGRNEVRNFLMASAIFWFEVYHIDGIRVDAVSSMIYLNHQREPGQWIPNDEGGDSNKEAVSFLRELNKTLFGYYPGILSIAEEATEWQNVSRPIEGGGLGFNFKWNMGWMNDTLKYFNCNPHDRSNYHSKLTFSLWYAFNENFMLALSHDEVVHGKGHLFQKMGGVDGVSDWDRIANLRVLFAYMFTHPGKKTLFMGMEFGQTHEWRYGLDLEWFLLDQELHWKLKKLVQDLNTIYRQQPALYTDDFTPNGFQWVDCHDAGRGMISFIRHDKHSPEKIVVVCNFKDCDQYNYWLGVPDHGTYIELINTDSQMYGGSGKGNASPMHTKQWNTEHFHNALEITVPKFTAIMFKLQ